MADGIYIFLGPSLGRAEAAEIVDATFLPPVQLGDVYRLVAQEPVRTIGIVDGVFERVPAVWHKEILYALRNGVRVLGAASMGALRAAELHSFGMEGVGEIFRRFRDNELEDDDEVAVAHSDAEDGFRCLSEPMVNIREGLERAEARQWITPGTRAMLTEACKRLFYPDRSWHAVFTTAAKLGVAADEIERLRQLVAVERPNLKRDDARMLLRVAAAAGEGPKVPDFEFEATLFWQNLVAALDHVGETRADASQQLHFDDLLRHVRLSPRRDEWIRGASLMSLGLELDEGAGELSAEELASGLERFRREHGLLSGEAMRRWATDQHVSELDLEQLIRLDMHVRHLFEERPRSSLARALILELKRRGAYGDVVRRLDERKQLLASRGISVPSIELAGTNLDELTDWYSSSVRTFSGSLEGHGAELGFATVNDFLIELLSEFIFARHRAGQPSSQGASSPSDARRLAEESH